MQHQSWQASVRRINRGGYEEPLLLERRVEGLFGGDFVLVCVGAALAARTECEISHEAKL